MAICVIAVVGVVPCQCFSPGANQTISPGPAAAVAQAGLFRELKEKGACLGLHMRPWKYSLWRHQGRRYFAHYGGLSIIEQHELLEESSVLWAEAIGHRPCYFRPGTFSANDAIFQVLAAQGFRGGSCSAPGRLYRRCKPYGPVGKQTHTAQVLSFARRRASRRRADREDHLAEQRHFERITSRGLGWPFDDRDVDPVAQEIGFASGPLALKCPDASACRHLTRADRAKESDHSN